MRTRYSVAVRDRADSPACLCRFCGCPIRHYDAVGWIDVTEPYDGGTYDICLSAPSFSHEPEHDQFAYKARRSSGRPVGRLFAANYAADMTRRRVA